MIGSILQQRSEVFLPLAYDYDIFHNGTTAKISPPVTDIDQTPVLNSSFITKVCTTVNPSVTTTNDAAIHIISFSPVLYVAASDVSPLSTGTNIPTSNMRILHNNGSCFPD